MRRTIPSWSRGWPWSLDVVRKVMRRNPALQKLGELHGPTRIYSADEAEVIRAAVERHATAGRNAPAAITAPAVALV